ncbi:MAG: hypothetical protein PHY59_05645 [Methanobacterium sp.]|nr:hypothetical protein [Methanobacterium sp.]
MAEDKIEKFEMRIPPGVAGQTIAYVMENYDLEVKQSDMGPVFQGDFNKLEDARDYIVKALNDRIQELEKNKDNIKED